MEPPKTNRVQTDYDRIATEYVRHIYEELKGKPLDRALLDALAEQVKGRGMVCDLGCGPGQVARYLHSRGATVCGIDLSPRMVEEARRLNAGLPFSEGNMLALDLPDASLGGIAAFYAIVHFSREELLQAVREMRRVLQPGGVLLLAFHIGKEVKHVEEMWGQPVSLDFRYFDPPEVEEALRQAGFEIQRTVEREPYEGVEYPSRRAYIFATKPA